ncbi:MAG: hypothetical protein ACFFCW_12060 [Candidatus Hodarchaeota archaeon]
MDPVVVFIITFLSGFVPTYVATPYFISYMKDKGFFGLDRNKNDNPKVAEMGGVILLPVIIGTLIVGRILLGQIDQNLFFSIAAIGAIGLVGFWDDLQTWNSDNRLKSGRKQALKVVFLWLASVPLIIGRIGNPIFNIPVIGAVDFGWLFWLIILPMIVVGSANLVNLLAGLNGLEVGTGLIVCLAILTVSLMNQLTNSILLMLALAGALIAFLYYNKFPAQIFSGDIGTLTIGGVIAIAVIQSGFKVILALVMIPQLVEFLISARVRFNCENFGIIQENGKLAPLNPKQSLTHYVMSLGEFSEQQVVYILWGITAVFAIIGVVYYILVF